MQSVRLEQVTLPRLTRKVAFARKFLLDIRLNFYWTRGSNEPIGLFLLSKSASNFAMTSFVTIFASEEIQVNPKARLLISMFYQASIPTLEQLKIRNKFSLCTNLLRYMFQCYGHLFTKYGRNRGNSRKLVNVATCISCDTEAHLAHCYWRSFFEASGEITVQGREQCTTKLLSHLQTHIFCWCT